jgi:general secretion pathway protein A
MEKNNETKAKPAILVRLYRRFKGQFHDRSAPRTAHGLSLAVVDDRTATGVMRGADVGLDQTPQMLSGPVSGPAPKSDPGPGAKHDAGLDAEQDGKYGAEPPAWKFRSRRNLADAAPLEKGYVSPNLPDVQVSGEPMVSVSSARSSTDAVLVPASDPGKAVRGSQGRESQGRESQGRAVKSRPVKGEDAHPAALRILEAKSLEPASVAKKPVANPPASATRPLTMASALDLYNDHFGLTERPFSLLPDPDFLFWSPAHRRAYTMLEYGILTCAPITLITGDVGAGKTTLVQHLLRTIDERVKIGLISNAHGSRGELLRWVLMALGQTAAHEATYVDLFATFQAYLIEEYGRGNRVILIFDEAQNLSRDALEELRMFTNINANKDELLQLVLVGQPELRDIVRRPDMRQFAQRVAANFHLSTMDAPTVRAYIAHRLKVAGNDRNVFNRSATDLIHKVTGGVPRLVNQLCDLSMVYTFTKNQKIIMSQTVQRVLEDGAFFAMGLDADETPSGRAPSNTPDRAGTLDED